MHIFRSIAVLICIGCLIPGILLTGCSDDDDKGTQPATGSWAWRPLGTGVNSYIYAMQGYNGKLYVGGKFTEAGGASANYVAAWNDSTWEALGDGTSWPVYAMTLYDGKLIIGGSFGSAGGIVVNKVAAWDGDSWSALGNGLEGNYWIKDLCVLRDSLFAVGLLYVGSDSTQFVAAYDGSTWGMIESGAPGEVREVCVHDNKLVVGGIDIVESSYVPFVKAMVGGQWYDYTSNSLPGDLHDLIVFDGYPYMGGTSTYPVKYFSVSWRDVGTDPFTTEGNVEVAKVRALCEFNGKLLAAGRFTSIGETSTKYIASWDGSSWAPLGDNGNSCYNPYCLTVWNNRLYLSGSFSNFDGPVFNYIAEWSYREDEEVN